MADRPRRVLIGYQQVETTPMRQFRCAATGVWDLRRMPVLRNRPDENGAGAEGYYWCPADRPKTSDDALGLWVKPIYATTKLPDGPPARCETCGITLDEVREALVSSLERVEGPRPEGKPAS